MNDTAITVCPKDLCAKERWGKGKVTRSIGTGAGLIFKGSGFYITDYRSQNYKDAAKKDVAPAKPASTDSKPAPASAKPAATAASSKPASP